MAVALLDNNIDTLENADDAREITVNSGFGTQMSDDERHNASISEVYSRLISSSSVDEVLGRNPDREIAPAPQKDLFASRPYLVENARADAAIFRADNPINRRALNMQPTAVIRPTTVVDIEEESEDLRPTSRTIQYKSVSKTVEEGKTENTGVEKRAGLSKKEKIVIAVIVSAIVAMFVLIIINSAVISVINADLGSLQSSLTTVKASFAGVNDEVNELLSDAAENAAEFAKSIGMIN